MRTAHRQAARGKRRWQADAASLGRVMARTQPYTDAEQAALTLPSFMALDTITSGKGTEYHLDTLAITTNCVLILSESVHPECVGVASNAVQAVLSAKTRLRKFGRVGFAGLELQAVRDVLDLYAEFLCHITPAQNSAALREVLARIKSGDFLEAA